MRVRHADRAGAEAALLAELDRCAERFWQEPASLGALGDFAAELALEPGCDAEGRPIMLLRAIEPCARPLVERVLALRPERHAASFAALQPRLGLQQALAEVAARTGVDLARATARAGFSRGHLLDVSVFVPGGRGAADEPAARQLVRALLGEDVFRDWIGDVRAAPVPRGLLRVLDNQSDERSFPLGELVSAVDAAVRGLHEGLPAEPWWAAAGEREYVVFELEVEPADEYPAQDDAALVSTCAPEMLHCFLRGASFASARFSRHGELFAYVKYRNGGDDLARAVEMRDALEQELDAALAGARAGRVVGRGIGLSFAYLNLALGDIDVALPLLRSFADRLPREAWLLFCDSHLGDEWVGLQPGAPRPPGTS
jgi:hypothetical protein